MQQKINNRPPTEAAIVRRAQGANFWARLKNDGRLINLAGRYGYLEVPYYSVQELELAGHGVQPTNRDMIDAYVTPLCLERAQRAGIPSAEYYITNGYFEPPAILDSVNPFMLKSRTVLKAAARESAARSLTRNYTYAICCQELPPDAKVKHFHAVLGWSNSSQLRQLAEQIWQSLHVPLARIRIIVTSDNRTLLSDVGPLPFERLSRRELEWIEKKVEWVDSVSSLNATP